MDKIHLYKGSEKNGEKFIAYILGNDASFTKMNKDYEAHTPALLAEYGKVIYFDYIDEPDQIAADFLRKYLKKAK